MAETTTATAIRHEITVNVPKQRAFSIFTERFGEIKPPDHSLLTSPVAETIFETHVGGTVYDVGEDGSECHWARVLVWEPPERFVISWDISARWEIETDPERTSEVEVRFIAETPDRTRLELEHRNLDRHGVGWEAERDSIHGEAGWPLYLQRFAELARA
jgi:uncharacterized protein YndB with AHSA1/START domain